jgi:hypothetical protein
MKGRCTISFIGPVRNGLPLISRGFHGRRRAHVEAARVPPGQYAEDPGTVSPVPQSKGKDDDLETSHARGDVHRDWDHGIAANPASAASTPRFPFTHPFQARQLLRALQLLSSLEQATLATWGAVRT